jgi:hypothetical protein
MWVEGVVKDGQYPINAVQALSNRFDLLAVSFDEHLGAISGSQNF